MNLPECSEENVTATEDTICRECRNPIRAGDDVVQMVFLSSSGGSGRGPQRHVKCPRTF